jgi:outer membrane protein assembly factor BamB
MKVIKFPLLGSALAGLLGLGILAGCGDGKTEPKFTMPENPSPWRADLTPRTTGSGPSAVAGAVTEDDKPQPNFGVTGVSLPAGSGEGSEPSKVAPPDRQTVEWAMWGGAPDRNMVSATQGITLDFDLEEKRLLWTANLGSQTYGNPIYAGGKVLVGSNNGAGYRPKYPAAKDMGVLLCFDATDGKFLWQLSREKMPSGRVNDWPLQGICSAPIVEGDRLWIVTNRCEVMWRRERS